MKRASVAAILVLASAPAWADEGDACQVSADCDVSLHCIEGKCAGVEHGKIREVHEPRPRSSVWFGNGHGYVTQIVIGDGMAALAAGIFVAAGFGARSPVWAIAALFPTTLVGPIIHAANGRVAAAIVSFFAWASAPPTSIGGAALTGLGTWNPGTAIATGSIVAGSLAIALTALDAFMAREVKSSFHLTPSIAPTRDGMSVSVVGTF